jgi:hypothetical protein
VYTFWCEGHSSFIFSLNTQLFIFDGKEDEFSGIFFIPIYFSMFGVCFTTSKETEYLGVMEHIEDGKFSEQNIQEEHRSGGIFRLHRELLENISCNSESLGKIGWLVLCNLLMMNLLARSSRRSVRGISQHSACRATTGEDLIAPIINLKHLYCILSIFTLKY